MTQTNTKIRRIARSEGVPLWRIANELGVSEPTITRWMRTPLSSEREQTILDAITRLAEREAQ